MSPFESYLLLADVLGLAALLTIGIVMLNDFLDRRER